MLFGVVRLVRDQEVLFAAARQNGKLRRVESQPLSNSASRKSSMVTLVQGLSRSRHQMLPPNKEIYAMKVIRKADMLRNAQEGHLRAERNFLVAAEGSKWVVPLITAFQDAKHLYLVMDFCVGGDFLGLLIRKSILSEQITKWYVAEMILCVEEAHKMKWIHRDVKPDNFLIGADGHLKISDFGLAFDGFWEHDQKYFHKHRHSLMSSLGVDVEGDTEDQRDAARRKRRQAEGKEGYESPPNIPDEKLCAATKERLVDWRNRNQRRKLARSVVGTSQYMAPEVIRGELYDGRCD
ncbi:hypothetical protein OHC33_002450 [Knufia fluminis]|uniref:non-specific serine/threonine protein kinase n=1 Tax=Knufia fluminis TaxID=191047 RepID=A0AAN8IAN8_9EURO|nr:hypothetical protein OHC33_002450 [Knufia fluminis]